MKDQTSLCLRPVILLVYYTLIKIKFKEVECN